MTVPFVPRGISRRRALQGGLSLAALTLFGFAGGRMPRAVAGASSLLGFESVPAQFGTVFDQVSVPPGYRVQTLFAWGDPIAAGDPPWRPDAGNDWRDQLRQAGDGHDGMHFFPLAGHDKRGLLVLNHEFANATLHPQGPSRAGGRRPLAEVRKEQAAHGASVIELQQRDDGWQRVVDSPYNRRITALTPMRLSGPLAGHAALRTVDDPDGRQVLGTLGNCAMGVTPWGTYLTCEENWHLYFSNENREDHAQRRSHNRYGHPAAARNLFAWGSADPRFDATPYPGLPHGGHVHEPHRFGYVVEIDPFDPAAVPVKRTATGRLCREGATFAVDDEGRMAVYFGDDNRGEYIYKFVPQARFDPANPAATRDCLDHGVLHVAVFHDDGSGEWRALQHGRHGLTAAAGFADQGDVLLNTRLAADHVGATPMDRPEWVAVHPVSRDVYITLTNNVDRGTDQPADAANPRPGNAHGHILRWQEEAGDPTALRFRWELFLLAGDATERVDLFSSPDSLMFDASGRLWIATDYDDSSRTMAAMGTNAVLCADPASGEVRRFLAGPRGCELTGMAFSPDGCTLWVNVQHPKLSFPASDGVTRPRSATVAITREDGGVIGAP